jgi:hypothetical protein
VRTLRTAAAVAAVVACAWPAAGHATTLSVKSTGPGTISASPQGTLGLCPTAKGFCRFTYPTGTVGTLRATPGGPNASLAKWLTACRASNPLAS